MKRTVLLLALVVCATEIAAQQHPATTGFRQVAKQRGYTPQQTECYVRYMQKNAYKDSRGFWGVQQTKLQSELPMVCGIAR